MQAGRMYNPIYVEIIEINSAEIIVIKSVPVNILSDFTSQKKYVYFSSGSQPHNQLHKIDTKALSRRFERFPNFLKHQS